MGLFSQRKGIRPTAKAIQRESIDEDLRNCLWSGLKIGLWDRWSPPHQLGLQDPDSKHVELVVKQIWLHYFKLAIDTIPAFDIGYPRSAYKIIREHFFNGQWWESYDLIEFLIKEIPDEWKERLKIVLNYFMESENAAYRIVGDEIVGITDEQEIETIESALDKGIKSCQSHLARALDLASDRKQPDYRNSIKESISAVEAACQVVAGMPKATLGDCIKVIKSRGAIHPAFEQALLKLYGYTSNEGGIRHALTDTSVAPAYSDAKFMLVACSAFVNFLWTKASELGIAIKT
ncbi:hypothetical protein MUO79_06355 [Candidatus Bathyarchaeota archaeon]|nr:hypothetical protein [Candidatus Bathyarchaeota archaeon]